MRSEKDWRFDGLGNKNSTRHRHFMQTETFITTHTIKGIWARSEMTNSEEKPFKNVRNQIGFCGIWCGSCTAGNGAILTLAGKFEETVKSSKLEKWVSKTFDFNEFMKGLTAIQSMPLCQGCLRGGGGSNCRIRICASAKSISNCSECTSLSECSNFEQIEKSHPKIREELKNFSGKDREKLIEKWTCELKEKWPHCVLFMTH
jgi:hypothetical protein